MFFKGDSLLVLSLMVGIIFVSSSVFSLLVSNLDCIFSMQHLPKILAVSGIASFKGTFRRG